MTLFVAAQGEHGNQQHGNQISSNRSTGKKRHRRSSTPPTNTCKHCRACECIPGDLKAQRAALNPSTLGPTFHSWLRAEACAVGRHFHTRQSAACCDCQRQCQPRCASCCFGCCRALVCPCPETPLHLWWREKREQPQSGVRPVGSTAATPTLTMTMTTACEPGQCWRPSLAPARQ